MRTVVETLNGYSFAVQRLEVPELDEATGEPVMNGNGPQMVPLTVLSFIDQSSPHRVDVPMPERMRLALVEQLTGGITIARGL